MTDLDSVPALQALDPAGMLTQVASLPRQFEAAASARTVDRITLGRPAVLVCGMGGSAIGGDFASACGLGTKGRIFVHRGYGLPSWVDADTLLVFSSYSGNTEETLDAFRASHALRAPRLCITTGGQLSDLAREAGVPVHAIPGGLQPRAALGHSLGALLVLLHETGVVPVDPRPELGTLARHLTSLGRTYGPDAPETENPAKRLARLWHLRLPFFYTGSEITQPVGVRWKAQVHENAKSQAATSAFPELDHNEIMAWHALPDVRRVAQLVFIRDQDDPLRVQKRMRLTAEILASRVGGLEWVDTPGESVLARMLGAAFLGDYASVYLAFLNGVDPTPVTEIEQLKKRLAD